MDSILLKSYSAIRSLTSRFWQINCPASPRNWMAFQLSVAGRSMILGVRIGC
jgi:hypothetical protein